jgi:Uncharacterized membrane protein, required for colicin V production
MEINYLDIAIAIILIIFAVAGLKKGLIVEVTSLLALFLGIYGAMYLSDYTAEHLSKYISIEPECLNTIAFIVTFLAVLLLINLLGNLISKIIEAINLGALDKIGGFIFGALKGLLIIGVLVMILNTFSVDKLIKTKTIQTSFLYPIVEKSIPYIYKGFHIVQNAIQDEVERNAEPGSSEDESEMIL